MEWLGTDAKGFMIRDIPTISIELGPNGAYMAEDKTDLSWGNLPDGLDQYVNQCLDGNKWKPSKLPACYALGYDGSYLMVTVDGGGAWSSDMRNQNAELDTFLTNEDSFSNIIVSVICSSCNVVD
jgi:hypothetical protein